MQDTIDIIPELVTESAMERIERTTIDCQIATAHQFPRSMASFKKRGMEMVTLDEETAQSCIFRRPVGEKYNPVTKKKETEYAEGKSIRMAEIVGACYGNLRVGAILVEQTERYVKARGMAHDLESNFAASSEVVESTVTKDGKPYSERMRMVVAKATLAKARRDATFQVVPGALCKTMEDAARTTAIGTTATLGKRRTLILDWINKTGIEPERVWQCLGINGIDDVGLKEMETLTGIRTAIKDKDITVEEAFPRADVAMPKAKSDKPPVTTPQAKSKATKAKTTKVDEPTTPVEGEHVLTGVCFKITQKAGTSAKGDYVKYGVCITTDEGQQWANTFSETVGDAAATLEGQMVSALVKSGKYGLDLIDIRPAETTTEAEPEVQTLEPETKKATKKGKDDLPF